MKQLFDPLHFQRGPAMKNRFALAPLTNCQSHDDGTLSDEEFHWLVKRADGGFGLTMTCAAHVQSQGKGFAGQLGVFSDQHLPGLSRLARALRHRASLGAVQLHHAGMRSPAALIHQQPLGPSDNTELGARAMTLSEVEQVARDFIEAAVRAQKAGFDGVELHGAHGYLICQFLSAETNQRKDLYGGPLENRARLLFDIIAGIRSRCSKEFQLGVRLSPERFGVRLMEMREIVQRLMHEAQVDYIDLSLWDVAKEPNEPGFAGRSLMSYFTELERGVIKLAAAGRISSGEQAQHCLSLGLDFVVIGRAAILHHDYPRRVCVNAAFTPVATPVTPAYLCSEGLSDKFIKYMGRWENFVAETDSFS
jgi:2,4-dienoyl-CoA reductase-like NADH-dependent reductase (Old Yellow Enzyme family)